MFYELGNNLGIEVQGLREQSVGVPIDDYEFRPITFQGEIFPATLMGISILVSIIKLDDEAGDWLWKLSNCRGVTKTAEANQCARCARLIVDLLLEQKQNVLDGIRDRLEPHGFDVEMTYRDWLLALQRIAELSDAAEKECVWSAPTHSRDGDVAAKLIALKDLFQ